MRITPLSAAASVAFLCCLLAITDAKVVDSSFGSSPPYADYGNQTYPTWVFLAKFCFDLSKTSTAGAVVVPPSLEIAKIAATAGSALGASDPNTQVLVYNDVGASWTHTYNADGGTYQQCKNKVAKAVQGGTRYVNDIKDTGSKIQVTETQRPHYWYVVLANCESGIQSASYKLHFRNPGGYYDTEFGFDYQGVLWIYSVFIAVFIIILILGLMSIHRLYNDYHPVGDLEPFRPLLTIFSMASFLEVIGCAMNIAHYASYASNGVGYPSVHIGGQVIHGMAECTLVLLVILVAKGWNINDYSLPVKFTVGATMFSLYSLYIAMIIIGNLHTEQPTVVYIYDTTPGMVINGLRVLFAFILIAVFAAGVIKASTAGNARSVAAMKSFMMILLLLILWLIAGPIASAIAGTVSPWVREKTGVSVENIAQAYGFGMMLWVLWPSKIHEFFQVSDTGLTQSIAEYDSGTGDSRGL